MIESKILSGSSFYTYKYYRESYWEHLKARFPIEALTGYACGIVSEKLWGNGKWFDFVNLKSYSTKFYGNRYMSSSQVKKMKSVAKYASGGLKWIGKGLGVYGFIGTVGEYNTNKLSTYGALYVGTADILGLTAGSLGAAWSLGTSLGKSGVESNWYFDLIHGGRRW